MSFHAAIPAATATASFSAEADDTSSARRALAWLQRLRVFAFAGQSLTVSLAAWLCPGVIYLPGLAGCLAFEALLTALAAWLAPRRDALSIQRWCAALLVADIIQLTLMLHWSGGAHNPFTSFYLLHVALAAILFSRGGAVALSALAIFGFVILNTRALELCGLDPSTGGIPADLHFKGMVVALALTGVSLAWFVGGLQSDLRRREIELRRSRERLAREERFASLATLAAGVAHELATPLGTIAVVCGELEHAIGTTCPKANCLDEARLIRREVDRCRAIIDRLAADSAEDLGDHPEAIPLVDIPRLLLAELSPGLAPRLSCELAPALHDRTLQAPHTALFQALGILLKNADDASPGSPVQLEISPAREGDTVVFIVRDHGAGIPPAIARRIGEPFLTTKPPGQGMGLGLYIVRLFAERLRGRLDLGPRPGGGTEVRLTLPLVSTP